MCVTRHLSFQIAGGTGRVLTYTRFPRIPRRMFFHKHSLYLVKDVCVGR